MKRFLKGGIFN